MTTFAGQESSVKYSFNEEKSVKITRRCQILIVKTIVLFLHKQFVLHAMQMI